MTTTRTDAEAREKVWELVKDVKTAMLVTLAGDGMRARPMQAAKVDEAAETLWFFTPQPSPKTDEVQQDGRVLLTYADPRGQNYVSVSGTARTMRDTAKQKELWSEHLRTWFPGGPEDPKAGLLQVKADGAEYWDVPNSALIYAYGYLKARITGKAPEPGESAKVDFRG
jgi:general stress protein 26